MPYLERKKVEIEQITCNHPKIKYCWEWGGLSPSNKTPEVVYGLTFIWYIDGIEHREDFRDTQPEIVKEKAEAFLQTL